MTKQGASGTRCQLLDRSWAWAWQVISGIFQPIWFTESETNSMKRLKLENEKHLSPWDHLWAPSRPFSLKCRSRTLSEVTVIVQRHLWPLKTLQSPWWSTGCPEFYQLTSKNDLRLSHDHPLNSQVHLYYKDKFLISDQNWPIPPESIQNFYLNWLVQSKLLKVKQWPANP